MDTTIQLGLAKKAGNVNHRNYQGRTWLDEYEYHLGMVRDPLPFELFRTKFNLLNGYFDSDPDGKLTSLDKPIQNLCNQLGY